MLKKLVKYGNSNALILDKAILELLEIQEGATVKLKTDGKSLIITPHLKASSAPVHETFTHEQATTEAMVKKMISKYKGLTKDEQERLEHEYQDLIKKLHHLTTELFGSPEFEKERSKIAEHMDNRPPEEIVEAFRTIRHKLSPELMRVETELMNFESKHKLSMNSTNKPAKALTIKQQTALEAEFLVAHKKNQGAYQEYANLLNNPDYQHQAQLITEKFGSDKHSVDYIHAMNILNDKYLPELRKIQEELETIATRNIDKKTK